MKSRQIRLIFSVVLIITLVVVFVIINELITDNRRASFKIRKDDDIFAFQVESVDEEEKDIVIRGWFFETKKLRNVERDSFKEGNIGIIVYNLDTEKETYIDGSDKPFKGIRTRTSSEIRVDIDSYFDCEYDYSKCGFSSRVDKSLVDLENGKYMIVLKEDEDDEIGLEVAYLINGRIEYTAPEEKVELNVAGTDLEKIVNEGTCLVSNPEYHIYVYQYGWNLYWIADKNYFFEEDGSTLIQYQMETTQFDKLPQYRIDNGWFSSNISDDFETNEITDKMNCGEYRVCVREIPQDYSITRISTGYYADGKWIWQRYFRPNYIFRNNNE